MKSKLFWYALAVTLLVSGCANKKEYCFMKYYHCRGLSCEKKIKEYIDSDENDEHQINYSLYRCYPNETFGKIIAEHIAAMHTAGWFKKISWTDLFHGHLLVGLQSKKKFDSPEEFIESIKAVIYHTHEFDDYWENEVKKGIPLSERTHRSLIGYKDGRLQPLSEIVDVSKLSNEKFMIYSVYGTIYSEDYLRQTSFANEVGDGFSINICGTDYDLKPNLWIVKRKNGKYSVGAERYDFFMKFEKYDPKYRLF